VLSLLGAMADLERSLIAERVKAGLRTACANGSRIRKIALFHISQLFDWTKSTFS